MTQIQTSTPSAVKAPPSKRVSKKASAPVKTGGGKVIKLLAKTNPHKAGSKRAGFWKKLRTGMSLSEVSKAGVPAIYIKRMVKNKNLSVGG